MKQGERRMLLAEGTVNAKSWDSGLRHMWDNHTPGWPTEGQAMVGEVRLERMGRRGADNREAQRLCSENITLVPGGEWALCGRGQGDP